MGNFSALAFSAAILLVFMVDNAVGAAAVDADNAECAAGEEPTSSRFVVQGGFILYIIGALYSLWALAYVCEDFLVPAVEVFCKRWKVPDSVAGSLVMAGCNDTPEIFVSFLGIFVQKSGIGIGTVIGSEIFNHMMISAGSAYYAKGGVLQLNGRQFTRDCFGYGASLFIFLWAVGAKPAHTFDRSTWTDCLNVTLGSAITLIVCQLLYCVVVAKYESICRLLGFPENSSGSGTESGKANISTDAKGEVFPGRANRSSSVSGTVDPAALASSVSSNPMYSRLSNPAMADDAASNGTPAGGKGQCEMTDGGALSPPLDAEKAEAGIGGNGSDGNGNGIGNKSAIRSMLQGVSGMKKSRLGDNNTSGGNGQTAGEGDANSSDSFLSLLSEACGLVLWCASLPLRYIIDYTIPNVAQHDNDNSSAAAAELREGWYPCTIVTATMWLSVFAYSLCECLTVLGVYFGISSVVMGLTFSAIGTSFPNMWSSLVVARQGKGDMAISNALGSNTFNIFMALGLPWLVYTILHGSYNKLQDGGIVYLTSLLLFVLLVYYAVVAANGWRLHSWMWIPFSVVYVIIIIICCTVN